MNKKLNLAALLAGLMLLLAALLGLASGAPAAQAAAGQPAVVNDCPANTFEADFYGLTVAPGLTTTLSFTISGMEGVVANDSITVTVDFGTAGVPFGGYYSSLARQNG